MNNNIYINNIYINNTYINNINNINNNVYNMNIYITNLRVKKKNHTLEKNFGATEKITDSYIKEYVRKQRYTEKITKSIENIKSSKKLAFRHCLTKGNIFFKITKPDPNNVRSLHRIMDTMVQEELKSIKQAERSVAKLFKFISAPEIIMSDYNKAISTRDKISCLLKSITDFKVRHSARIKLNLVSHTLQSSKLTITKTGEIKILFKAKLDETYYRNFAQLISDAEHTKYPSIFKNKINFKNKSYASKLISLIKNSSPHKFKDMIVKIYNYINPPVDKSVDNLSITCGWWKLCVINNSNTLCHYKKSFSTTTTSFFINLFTIGKIKDPPDYLLPP